MHKLLLKSLPTAILIFLSLSSFGQKDSAYKMKHYLSVGALYTTGFDGGYGLSVSAGAKIGKVFGIGAGWDIIKFADMDGAYMPFYADIRGYVIDGFFLAGNIGYSFYNQEATGIRTTGGFYYGYGAGYMMKTKVGGFIILRGANYRTETKYTDFGYETTSSTSKMGFTITLGAKI